MVINKKRLRQIMVMPGVLLAGVFMSSFGIFPQDEFSFLPFDVAKVLIVVSSMYGTVEMLTKLAGVIYHCWDKRYSE
ncbi:hypothetical protein J2X14_001112 [Pantoea alhagi]|uniref:hypothetical protein n=1 Tax=Mixta sp. BE291 TaxID=3158787 RepID=UPI002858C304|nr:hypothetical protein [Pantoea alhagi]